eukprot:1153545-Pelagomonas_calceolata.AAC.5
MGMSACEKNVKQQKQRRPPVKTTDCYLAHEKKEALRRIGYHFAVVLIHESEHFKGLYRVSSRQAWNRLGRGTEE